MNRQDINILLDDIVGATTNYKTHTESGLRFFPIIFNSLNTRSPENIRTNYDSYFNRMETGIQASNAELIKIETSIKNLEESKNTIKTKIIPEYEKIKVLINSKAMGTLEGLSRQAISKNHMLAQQYEGDQTVVDQQYDELAAVDKSSSIGGHNRYGKTKRKLKRRYFSKKNRR